MATRLDTPRGRLTGRDRELRLAWAALDDARAGQLSVLLLTGPGGSGRSRMLRETAAAARDRGHEVVAEVPDRPAAGSTLVVCSDHPHRIAAADWDGLDRLADSVPVLVVLTARTGHDPVPLDRLASPRVRRVTLSPLGPAAATALTAGLLGAEPGRDLADLLRVAAGRPRVLHDLITGLQEEGLLRGGRPGTPVTLTAVRLPARTAGWVQEQLAALSPQARHLAHAATTLRAAFPLVQLTRLLAVPPLHVVPAVAELLDSGLLAGDGELLTFTHDLVRRAVSADLPRPVAAALAGAPGWAAPAGAPGWAALSPREREIALLAGQGLTNQQIATRVGRTTHTVNFHLRQIFPKLGVASRVELAALIRDTHP
ncbi:helix-turn-helix transcriptional regulator [Actinoplanes sp. RD1]|uniref:helix-turn-helix transcriptional regulator n=1 Tax=Actinoplanes sp. RD1 TaxID=3064538 RepID=UPI00274170FC|nr:LuxR family transcriptional regulator [Actinoplanes sp. RD1]